MRQFFNKDPRPLLEFVLEDMYLNELHRTGHIEDLDISMGDVLIGAAERYPAPQFNQAVAEAGYVSDLIHAEVDKMAWGDE